jgi:hypothetical protein
MVKNYDKKSLLSDYRAGNYTQRTLADKYSLRVSKITKNLEKDLMTLVNKKIEAQLALAGKSEQEIKAIDHAVEFQ